MKVIIAGSRHITSEIIVQQAVDASRFEIALVVSGGARGIDALGEQWANARGIPVKRFIAKWSELGRKAGPLRNGEMAVYADALIAIWDGMTTGTQGMIAIAETRGIKVYVHHFAAG